MSRAPRAETIWRCAYCGNLHYAAGVQAAREAVPHEICCWGSDTDPCDCFHASVIAAIDALKEKP